MVIESCIGAFSSRDNGKVFVLIFDMEKNANDFAEKLSIGKPIKLIINKSGNTFVIVDKNNIEYGILPKNGIIGLGDFLSDIESFRLNVTWSVGGMPSPIFRLVAENIDPPLIY